MKGNMDLLVKWKSYEEMPWETMEVVKVDDPVTLEKYV